MAARIPPNFRRVITAAAGGNVIEWYDFYIFGSLAAVLSVKFFEKTHPVAALLSTIALFTAGFLVRPLGAFLFGWMGDRIGRKYTFLVTLTGMALGTGAIGLIPTFDQIGLAAAVILFCLRMIQGLCLGGQYGGAITYVAEHVSDERRGYYTGWLQTSPTLGIVLSLIVIIVTRAYLGVDAFNAWGWLSDKIGRKPIILGGMLLAALTYYPLYQALGRYTEPGAVNHPMAVLIVVILVNYVGMTYGPIGAFLAEFFPGRIRYTSVSVPYHIGNGWGGGLVPIITTSAYLSTGSLGWALAYPIALPAVSFLLSLFLMPETRKHSIWEEGAIEAQRSRA